MPVSHSLSSCLSPALPSVLLALAAPPAPSQSPRFGGGGHLETCISRHFPMVRTQGPEVWGGLPSVPRYQESLPLLGAAQLFPHLLPWSPLSGPPEGHLSHSTCAPAKPGGWTGVAVGRRGRGMHTSWPSQGPSPACPGCFSIHPLWPSLWEEKDLLLELEPPPQVAPTAPRHGSSVFQGLSLLTTCLECPWAVFSEPKLCVLLAWPGIPGPPLGSCGTWGKPMNLLAPGVLIWSRVVITVPPPPGPL